VRVLLLMLLFVVWESSIDAPRLRVDPATGAMVLAIGYGVLVAAMGVWGRRAVRSDAVSYDRLGRRVVRFNLGMGLARGAIPAWFAVGIYVLGWRRLVEQVLVQLVGPAAVGRLATPGVVVGLLPPLLAWAGLWWSQYPVDRAVREQGVLAALEAELPIFAPPSFAAYFANRLRTQLLFTTVPVLLILSLRDAATVGLHAAARAGWSNFTWPPSTAVDGRLDLAAVALVLVFIPVVLRRVLSTRRLPDGRLRQALGEVLRLAGVRCREVLLWDTHNNVGNAAVMGVLPPVRYVMLSDLLLESMTDEHVQAVFAHELGHVRHRHLAWFAAVLGSALAVLSAGGDWVADRLHPATAAGSAALQACTVAALAAFVWLGYGSLSRWFERQADVYAARLMDRVHVGGGAAAFAGALRRVAVVNNIPFDARNWTHGSIAARVAFIERFAIDPAVGPRFDAAVRRVRAGLVVSVLACTAASGWWYFG
jgi:STE24 endopeptidase